MNIARPLSPSLRTARRTACTLFAVGLLPWLTDSPARAQSVSGAVDPGFVPANIGAGGLDDDFNPAGSVQSTALQIDGKLIVAGSQIRGIVRLNADGSKDTSFDVGAGTDGTISSVVRQSDGSILIGGEFTQINGVPAAKLARLKPDGTIDANFKPQVNGSVRAMTMLSNGQLAVGGEFSTINQAPAKTLARLNMDGTVDSSFQGSMGTDGTVYALAENPDGSGRLLVGGDFNNLGGALRANIGQLNADGSADASFSPETLSAGAKMAGPKKMALTARNGTDGVVRAIQFLLDHSGRALIGGSFSNVGPVPQQALAQVLPNGQVDTSFRPGGAKSTARTNAAGVPVTNGISGGAATVYSIQVQLDNKVVVGGAFNQISDALRNSLARLTPDGSVDTAYNVGSGANASVRSVKLQSDGKSVVAGGFSQINNVSRGGVARLTADNGTAAFFSGQAAIADGFYYLKFPNGNPFGFYNLEGDGYRFPYFFHSDLGQEYFFDANDGNGGAYLYDFASSGFFYTSPNFPWPYLYDFSLNTVLYYYADPTRPDHFNTNDVRYFYSFGAGQIISK